MKTVITAEIPIDERVLMDAPDIRSHIENTLHQRAIDALPQSKYLDVLNARVRDVRECRTGDDFIRHMTRLVVRLDYELKAKPHLKRKRRRVSWI